MHALADSDTGQNDNCVTCRKPCSSDAIECDGCFNWCHVACNDVSMRNFKSYMNGQMINSGFKWFCRNCRLQFDKKSHKPLKTMAADLVCKPIFVELDNIKTNFNKDIENPASEILSLNKLIEKINMTNKRFEENSIVLNNAPNTLNNLKRPT